jgi:hypothetical protein
LQPRGSARRASNALTGNGEAGRPKGVGFPCRALPGKK